MKGDFTRWSFDHEKHYHTVLKQQGRVDLDADWNEQEAIVSHRVETETMDVVGPSGAPAGPSGGFAISVKGTSLQISKGRAYVDGLLCENEQDVLIVDQPDFPNFKPPTASGTYIAFLEVWLRHTTAIDDSRIREDALGGPDTCTRAKTVWQVNLLEAGALGSSVNCSTAVPAWDSLIAASTATLAARAMPNPSATDPCIVPSKAGYRSLENQLYRVEIHNSSGAAQTYKWSRDNGSVAVSWTGQNGNDLTVSSTGADSALGFAPGQWIELVDDTHELSFTPGTLVQLANVQGNTLTINPGTATGPVAFASFPETPKVRRWDSAGLVPLTTGTWQDLEDGVQVQFAAGTCVTGDHWLIPARTLKADVEWPLDASSNPVFELPTGIHRHYCKLAIVQLNGSTWSLITQCLPTFPPLTQIPSGQDKGIHVTSVQISPGPELLNDSDVLITSVLREFAIRVNCESAIDPVSAQPATCFVAVEVPFPLINTAMGGPPAKVPVLGFQRLILPGAVSVTGNAIVWRLGQPDSAVLLEDLLNLLVRQQGASRLLTRLMLIGNVIWGLGDPTTYLDGEAFGVTRTDADGTHIGLRLPQSGDGKRGGNFEMWFWLVLPVRISGVSMNSPSVDAGQSSTGLITLNGPAPAGGAVITLSSVALDASGAQLPGVALGTLPGSLSIAAGQTTGNFSVAQMTLPSNSMSATMQITATYAGNTTQANLTITRPIGLTALSFTPVSLLGGNPTSGTLTLSGPAPTSGAVVELVSNSTLAKPPSSVTIPGGQSSVNFTLSPTALPINATAVPVQITASYNGRSVQGGFTITAERLT